MDNLEKCSVCDSIALDGLHITCHGQQLCKECLIIFMQEQEILEVYNGGY